jgi:hypothetical protein
MDGQSKNNRLKPITSESINETEDGIDPLHRFKAFSDDSFVKRYQKKWGVEKKLFTPITTTNETFDSHTTLSNIDQRKVNAILDRNLNIYYHYAVTELSQQ